MSGKYQPFNDLPAAQFSGLVDDIAKRGVLLPIIVDEDDKTIDGHQRRRAAAEAGVECPKVVVEGLSEEEKQTLAITLNLFRRHLAGVERTRALQQLANLGLSTRRMADILGVSKSTVHNDLTSLSNSGQWQRPDKVRGEDGREQPSKKPERVGPPANVDPETGEILDTANSGSDQVDGVSPAAAGPDDDDAEKVTSDPSPAPKVAPTIPPVDPTLGYRAKVSREIAAARNGGLLSLDPERAVATADPDGLAALRWLAGDLVAFADAINAALSGSHLKAVQ